MCVTRQGKEWSPQDCHVKVYLNLLGWVWLQNLHHDSTSIHENMVWKSRIQGGNSNVWLQHTPFILSSSEHFIKQSFSSEDDKDIWQFQVTLMGINHCSIKMFVFKKVLNLHTMYPIYQYFWVHHSNRLYSVLQVSHTSWLTLKIFNLIDWLFCGLRFTPYRQSIYQPCNGGLKIL